MVQQSIDKIWNDYNKLELDKADNTKRTACVKLESMSQGDMKKKMKRELDLQNFIWFSKQSLDNEIINVELFKSVSMSFLNNCDNYSLEYYQERLDDTPSLHNKFSYSFGCWILTKNIQFLNNAIDFLISNMHYLIDQNKFDEVFTKILIISNLIRFYNLGKPHLRFNEILTKLIYKIQSTDNARWMLEPIFAFSATNTKPDLNLIHNLLTVTHRSANHLGKNGERFLEKRLYDRSLGLVDLLELSANDKGEIKKKIHELMGESLERAGDARLEEGLVALTFFDDAKTEYRLAERHDRVKDLDVKIRIATQNIQWKETSVTMEMQPLVLDGNNEVELINSICQYVENIPPMNWVRDLVRDLNQKHPISSLFPHISINGNSPTNFAETEEEIFESQVKTETIRFIRLGESRLSVATKDLEDEELLSTDGFIEYLKSIGLHDESQIEIMKSGIEDHFNKRYIASISTLTPMIEGTIRALMQTKGIQILRDKQDMIFDTELGGLLADERVKELLGNNFTNYLKTKYADPDGMNERNKVSHALSKSQEFNHESSFVLIKNICNIAELSLKTE